MTEAAPRNSLSGSDASRVWDCGNSMKTQVRKQKKNHAPAPEMLHI